MKTQRGTLSRRQVLGELIALPAFAALATAVAAAEGKAPKAQFAYQSSPHGKERCANCRVFHPGVNPSANGTCDIVQGSISPNGWCRVFQARTQSQ